MSRFQSQQEWRLERLTQLARLVKSEIRNHEVDRESRQLLPEWAAEIEEHAEWLQELNHPGPPLNPVAAQAQAKAQPQPVPQPQPVTPNAVN